MIVWHGDEWLKKTRDEMAKRLEKAAIYLQNQVKQLLSERGPPRSNPGDPPHMDSGKLRQSITHEVDQDTLTARVGTNLIYSRYLSLGTAHMAIRPFLDSALESNKGVISSILKGK